MRLVRVFLILGALGALLIALYQNADLIGAKSLQFPRYLASIHETQMAKKKIQVDPETYLQNIIGTSPANATIGRFLRDESPKSPGCNIHDPGADCDATTPSTYQPKSEEMDLGMDPLAKSARLRIGSTFETSMKSWDKNPTLGVRKDLSPNACLNIEMKQNGNEGRVLFDLKF